MITSGRCVLAGVLADPDQRMAWGLPASGGNAIMSRSLIAPGEDVKETVRAQTREAAGECTGALWRVGNAAMSGDESAMRKELGVE